MSTARPSSPGPINPTDPLACSNGLGDDRGKDISNVPRPPVWISVSSTTLERARARARVETDLARFVVLTQKTVAPKFLPAKKFRVSFLRVVCRLRGFGGLL